VALTTSPAALGQAGADSAAAGGGSATFGGGAIFAALTGTFGIGLADWGWYGVGSAAQAGAWPNPRIRLTARPAAIAMRGLDSSLRPEGRPAGRDALI
jgi:hypothetical protein